MTSRIKTFRTRTLSSNPNFISDALDTLEMVVNAFISEQTERVISVSSATVQTVGHNTYAFITLLYEPKL